MTGIKLNIIPPNIYPDVMAQAMEARSHLPLQITKHELTKRADNFSACNFGHSTEGT